VDGTPAFLNPSASAAFVVGRENEACSVRVQLPPEWRAWVALPFEDGAWKAQDYDELADSPFECGPLSSHSAHTFTAQGVEHELVVWGRGDFDALRVLPDLAKIVDGEAAVFGGLPYGERYLFILHLNDKGRGGLEHRRSCALVVPRFSFVQKAAYEDFLLLAAHEFFHLWNVKRLRPTAFTPYDWTRENHTRLLWAMEGLTSTYEVLALRRAGLITPQRFLEIWAERITQLLRTPGRLPLEEALAGVGLKAVIAPAASADDKGGAEADPGKAPETESRSRPWLGATLKEKGGALEVASVAEGSPAQASGLASGDEIVA